MRYTNLNMDTTLGGENASDEKIASQKAIKTYVDENDKDNITEMDDVNISEVSIFKLVYLITVHSIIDLFILILRP